MLELITLHFYRWIEILRAFAFVIRQTVKKFVTTGKLSLSKRMLQFVSNVPGYSRNFLPLQID